MIEQQGRVIAAKGSQAWVRLGGKSGCAACDAGRGCGAGLFGRLLRGRGVVLQVENGIRAEGGQAVIVGLAESRFCLLAVRFYLLPLLAGLGGATIGHYLGTVSGAGSVQVDMSALLAGLVAGLAMVWRNRYWSIEFSRNSVVHLLRVVANHDLNPDNEVVS